MYEYLDNISVMSNINTTSIHDLPTDPIGGGTVGGNVSLVANEIQMPNLQPQQQQQPQQYQSLDQSTISQIVNGLQQASLTGLTTLPSRDIPVSTQQLTNDPSVQANYISPPAIENNDYINSNDANEDFDYPEEKNKNYLDSIYDEIQIPLLISILYFVFQLPIFKKSLFKYLPFLCNNDGNYNVNGLLFTSALFGFIFYSVIKFIVQFNKF
jgi:hypothetical protein